MLWKIRKKLKKFWRYSTILHIEIICNMIAIAELQLLACIPVAIVAGFVFYWIRKKRRENKVKT